MILEFRSPVLRVRLNNLRIVVALQNAVHIYQFLRIPKLLSIYETANNDYGLCALTSKKIAFPGRTPGQVQLVEVDTGNLSILPAHTSALRALGLSADGQVLVTASEVVRLTVADCSFALTVSRGL